MATERRHHCHARGCTVPVPPKLLMCRRHWFMVPKPIRDRVWEHYQPGQEDREVEATEAWHQAADDAINAVAECEAGVVLYGPRVKLC